LAVSSFFIGKDRDSIRVGRVKGASGNQLAARGNTSKCSTSVIYTGGEPDDIPVRSHIRPAARRARSARSRAGRDRIDMVYHLGPFPRSGDRLRRRIG
jgi:hypothetical protein